MEAKIYANGRPQNKINYLKISLARVILTTKKRERLATKTTNGITIIIIRQRKNMNIVKGKTIQAL